MLELERKQLINKKELFISCVVPVYNEEENIVVFFSQLAHTLQELTHHYEIIVVDDGSGDATADALLGLPPEYHIKLIKFSRNFGKEVALAAGLKHSSGQVTILMDADLQHPMEMIAQFIEYWGKGFDMVYGTRKNRDNESRIKRYLAGGFYWLMSKIGNIDIPRHAGDFRLLDAKVVLALNHLNERTRFMKGLYAWVGFKKIGLSYDVQDRMAGKSSWGVLRLIELAMTGITSFSDIPLRIWGFIGFVISVISFIYALYIVGTTLIYGTDLPGFPTLAAAIMFFGGIQLLSIGILGEYIARIFTEVKQRPNYIIEMKKGFEELRRSVD